MSVRRAAARVAAACLAGPLALAGRPAAAEPLEAGGRACGGDAYSSAQVTEGRGRRRGPLTAVPDTLCADLEPPQAPVRIDLYGVPDRDGVGGGAGGAPYERPLRRRPPAD